MNTDQWVENVLSRIKYPVSKPEDIVLEPGLLVCCKSCEREFGVDQQALGKAGWMVSHKACLRHIPQQVSIMVGKNEPNYGHYVKKTMIGAIKRITADHWKGESRDLSKPENKVVLQWLKNPTSTQKPTTTI